MTTEPHLSTQRFQWQPNKKLLVLSFCLFPLLVVLGFWQLDRADEKQRILDQYNTNQQAPPAMVADLMGDSNLQYRSAWLVGELDSERRLILDNRVKNGRPGYEILEALSVVGLGQKVLVNRGWVPASLDRNQLPEIPPLLGSNQLRGALYQTLGGYRLDDGIGLVEQWPARVGWISAARAEELYGEDFFAYQFRLDQDSQGALNTGWPTVSVQPSKHTGYAVQWFVMAMVLIIMTLIANSNLADWLRQRSGT
ncbi:SURF1 family protein [Porticoccaceae bacterium]|nr:SURF1 family protein [Porticoccaceae bacterium]MDB4309115.1 SURF1 family protein [Porticoccaceae bacterium]MDB9952994.1 SURF1 family protein [Porticoccaceae bacterium]